MAILKEVEQIEASGDVRMRHDVSSSRTDFFPKLVGIQRALNAKNFAVFRTTSAGFMSKRRLTLELENFGSSAQGEVAAILSAFEDQFIEHLERSILPLVWSGSIETGIGHQPSVPNLLRTIDNLDLSFAGIALPVRLGSTGNGIVVFTGQSLILDNELILEQHIKACQIMVELVAIEERRSAPSEALSEREIACLQLAGDGCISEEIALNLGLSVHTVNAYLGSATIKLDSVNRIQAIAKAIKLGYIH